MRTTTGLGQAAFLLCALWAGCGGPRPEPPAEGPLGTPARATLAPATPGTSRQTASSEVTMEWKGQFCAESEPSTRVARTQAEWASLWTAIGQAPPQADLGEHVAVAVFLGLRNTGGYGVRFLDPAAEGRTLTVRFETTRPKGFAIQALTRPYAVRLFPKTDLDVRVVEASR